MGFRYHTKSDQFHLEGNHEQASTAPEGLVTCIMSKTSDGVIQVLVRQGHVLMKASDAVIQVLVLS